MRVRLTPDPPSLVHPPSADSSARGRQTPALDETGKAAMTGESAQLREKGDSSAHPLQASARILPCHPMSARDSFRVNAVEAMACIAARHSALSASLR